MKAYLMLLSFVPLLGFMQSTTSPGNEKESISIGLFDHETGFSLIGYTRTIFQHENNRFFVGAGSSIFVNTISVGATRTLLKSSSNKILYSTISIRGVYGSGKIDDFIAPTIAIGIDFPGKKWKDWLGLERIRWTEDKWLSRITQQQFFTAGINSTIRIINNRFHIIAFPYFSMKYRW